jgi:hypothetical protein
MGEDTGLFTKGTELEYLVRKDFQSDADIKPVWKLAENDVSDQ